jgi:hypothetical protein
VRSSGLAQCVTVVPGLAQCVTVVPGLAQCVTVVQTHAAMRHSKDACTCIYSLFIEPSVVACGSCMRDEKKRESESVYVYIHAGA